MASYLLLFIAAFVAGAINAVAGGGSFVSFPALVFTGVPSIVANATNTVALFPGAFASAWAYRDSLRALEKISFKTLIAMSVAGGITGALLLLYTPQSTFDALIPWLLLFATVLFAFGRPIADMIGRELKLSRNGFIILQFCVSVYAGYFGGAAGIIILTMLSLFGLTDIHAMNANKTLMAGFMNAAAVVCFVAAGKIWWPQTAVMLVGAVVGGFVAAHGAKRMNPIYVRRAVIALSVVITAVFFARSR